jgi:glycoprotein 6-alpha-L-fucosyltransferase
MMQHRYPDASWRFKSLDDVYYYGGQNDHQVIAIYEHNSIPNRDEIELIPGDVLSLAGNHWNGYSKGRNHRTNAIGLFPSYKVMELTESSG